MVLESHQPRPTTINNNFYDFPYFFSTFFLQPNYSTYAPSPSPYGNLGPTNISHTSTTMLVPSNSILSGGHHVPSIIGSSNTLMYPSPPITSQMGTY